MNVSDGGGSEGRGGSEGPGGGGGGIGSSGGGGGDGDGGSGGSLVEAAIDDFKLEFVMFNPLITGDLNGDLVVNVLDVILLVNMVLGFEDPNYTTGDINSDSQINILDVVLLVNIILET